MAGRHLVQVQLALRVQLDLEVLLVHLAFVDRQVYKALQGPRVSRVQLVQLEALWALQVYRA